MPTDLGLFFCGENRDKVCRVSGWEGSHTAPMAACCCVCMFAPALPGQRRCADCMPGWEAAHRRGEPANVQRVAPLAEEQLGALFTPTTDLIKLRS
jgi:hypothetical protein